jgi:hypothetical protein
MKYLIKLIPLFLLFFLLAPICSDEEENEDTIYHCTFTINGTEYDFVNKYSCQNLSCWWYEYIDAENDKNMINIRFPSSVSANDIFTGGITDFTFEYKNASGESYYADSYTSLSLTVTSINGTIAGTFSGGVQYGSETLIITNGSFEALKE